MAQDSSQEDVFTFEMSLVKEASGSGLFASKLPGGRSLGGIYFVWQLELALSSGGRGFGLGCDGAWGRCTRGDAAEGLGTLIASEDATNTSRRDKDLAENSLMPMTMLQIDSKASPSTIEEGLLFQALQDFRLAHAEGLDFIKACRSTPLLNHESRWSLPVHGSLRASHAAQQRILVTSGDRVEVVNTNLNQELFRHWGDKNMPRHTDVTGPSGAGKSTALYTALVMLQRRVPNARVLYIAHASEWAAARRSGSEANVSAMQFLLCKFFRAFAEDPPVWSWLQKSMLEIGIVGWVTYDVYPLRFLRFVREYLEKNQLVLHVIVDAAEFIFEDLVKTWPFSLIDNLGRLGPMVKQTLCGTATYVYIPRRSHDAMMRHQWPVQGSFPDKAFADLLGAMNLPFNSSTHPSLFLEVRKLTGGNPLEVSRFAKVWASLDEEGVLGSNLEAERYGEELVDTSRVLQAEEKEGERSAMRAGGREVAGAAVKGKGPLDSNGARDRVLDKPPRNWGVLEQVRKKYEKEVRDSCEQLRLSGSTAPRSRQDL